MNELLTLDTIDPESPSLQFDHKDRDDNNLFDPILSSKDDPTPDELFRESPAVILDVGVA